MIVLFDYDSLIYSSVYRIVDYSKIRSWFEKGKARDWMEKEIVALSINRLEQMAGNIFQEIEDTGVEISGVEYFITTNKNDARKAKVSTYKAQRKRNKWVSMVRKYLIEMDFAKSCEVWEADDLIADRCAETEVEDRIVLSIDKDMKQIEGFHFDYWRPRSTYDDQGNRIVHRCRGLSVMTEEDSNMFFWTQMLVGDGADNIKGVKGIGPKTAEKLLKEEEDLQSIVYNCYDDCYQDGGRAFRDSYFLLKLGTREL